MEDNKYGKYIRPQRVGKLNPTRDVPVFPWSGRDTTPHVQRLMEQAATEIADSTKAEA
jgi:hypothetical protein